ncbi:ribokinase [Leifsonia sp. YIM 134122]|uniref:Ribokinase n=1 Tax=Leifsonia stereocauli TaxID=3134136 RepID=A0ABU9W3W0_9MICO
MTGRVLVLGSLNVDSTSYVADFPAPGETVPSTGYAVALGGKGTNQAIAAHLAGASVDLVARVGTDAAATFALETVRGFGVALDAIDQVPDAATGVAQITVAASGENTVIVSAGANAHVTAAAVEAHRWDVAAADVALTQGELPVEAVERLASLSAEVGTRFVLNLAPPVPVSAAALAVCDPLVVNQHEAVALGIGTGETSGLDAWRTVAESVAGRRCRSIVITLGAEGAVSAAGSESASVDSPDTARSSQCQSPRVTAVDSTGAGDCFTGTLASFLSEGRQLSEAVAVAVAAGALSVTSRGTVGSYAPRADLLAFAARSGIA